MALELNADIAKELNITARKGDSFQVRIAVQDPSNNNMPLNLSGTQIGATNDSAGGFVTRRGPIR